MKIHSHTEKADSILDTLSSEILVSAHGRTVLFRGIWDTGATGSVITQNVVDALGLKPIDAVFFSHANGTSETEEYVVDFKLPNGVDILSLCVIRGTFDDYDLLIGMDIISRGDFSISNFNGKTMFGFRMPSVADVNFQENEK